MDKGIWLTIAEMQTETVFQLHICAGLAHEERWKKEPQEFAAPIGMLYLKGWQGLSDSEVARRLILEAMPSGGG